MTEQNSNNLDDRLNACREIIRKLGSVVVAFSAGVDSTYLLALAAETLGCDKVLAATGVSSSLPQRELATAREFAGKLGVELVEIPTGELDNPQYTANPAERCYFCKHELFSRLIALAKDRGFNTVVCGANLDDTGDFRPGLKAGAELGVCNPLMEAGLRKADIREFSRRMNLPTWDKPAMACLASRVPYGDEITQEKLARIEKAEAALRDMGFQQCRLRDHGRVARIEVPPERIVRAVELRGDIVAAVKLLGYSYVTLDLEGFRSGSLNEIL